MLLGLYKNLLQGSTPLLEAYLRRRTRRGKEDPARASERRGRPQMPRPAGRLVWVHAASVGESMSMLSVIDRLLALHDDIHILVTTGTVTSARMMATRLPPRAFHQYAPVDHPEWVAGFLDHWRPDLALWAESELWPNTLTALKARGIPALLVSARITEKSTSRWKTFAPGMIREILGAFDLCIAQNALQAARLTRLGARHVEASATLKYGADPLPVDTGELAVLRAEIGGRPCILWSSTHPGEEKIALESHAALRRALPELLSIIVPRHPARGAEVTALSAAAGFRTARRTKKESLAGCDVYVADTMGELGTFYALCRHVVMCGSFANMGGHNMIEAAQAGCVILTGPVVFNFQTVVEDFRAAGAIIEAGDPADLQKKLAEVLAHPEKFDGMAASAQQLTAARAGIVDAVAARISSFLKAGGST